MRGRDFLGVARSLLSSSVEAHRRAVVIHSYYALMLECRDALLRWGVILPPRHNVHSEVRLKFAYSGDADLKALGDALDALGRNRNVASYNLSLSGRFSSNVHSLNAFDTATQAIDLLDVIDSNPAKRP